jgi:Zn-dependent protease with chaperone function
MSRGKVFVFTGILPIAQDENGLAAVLGHEIAHIVAHHPAERMSGSVVALIGIAAISILFDVSGQLPSILMNTLYSLPNSRKQEVRSVQVIHFQFLATDSSLGRG